MADSIVPVVPSKHKDKDCSNMYNLSNLHRAEKYSYYNSILTKALTTVVKDEEFFDFGDATF